jgi:hypothetical protein
MTCSECEKRKAQEQRQLSDCESRCKEMGVKNQRLTLALAVVATLVGKESLDFALGLSSTLEQIAHKSSDNNPVSPEVSAAVASARDTDWGGRRGSPSSPVATPNVLFAEMPALTPMLFDSDALSFDDPMQFDFFTEHRASIVPASGLGVLGIAGLSLPRRKR